VGALMIILTINISSAQNSRLGQQNTAIIWLSVVAVMLCLVHFFTSGLLLPDYEKISAETTNSSNIVCNELILNGNNAPIVSAVQLPNQIIVEPVRVAPDPPRPQIDNKI
jgi:hypothetical protein